MTGLRFRNVDADPSDPVQTWPIEAMQTALERGALSDWRRIMRAVRADPWGQTARTVEYVLSFARPYGTAELMERGIARERERAELADRATVADQIRAAVRTSGLSQKEFAARLGTSQSRLSTYASGRVTPSAAILVRARRLAGSAALSGRPRAAKNPERSQN